MRVYLDDIRQMPEGFTHLARNYQEAVDLLKTGKVEFISLDHDLSLEHYPGNEIMPQKEKTGYDVACWIEENVMNGNIPMPNWKCHSMNPVGRTRIEVALLSLQERRKL